MFSTSLQIIWISVIAFIPILIWAYIFSYLNNSELNSRRFLAWIIAWWISVVPVLYSEEILNTLWIKSYNLLEILSSWVFEPLQISISLLITILSVWIFSLIAGLLFIDNISKIYRTYLKNLVFLNLFILIFLVLYYLIADIWLLSWKIKNSVEIGKSVFWTTWLILLYYIIVWLLEESSKHFNFIPSSLAESDTIKKWVMYAIFIALGFWFVENILYLFNIFRENWFSSELISIWIFRWIFSLFVHILCSSLVIYSFIKMYLKNNKLNFNYVKTFLIAFSLSIAIHAIYDISLTLDFTAIIFIYLIFWYLYVTKIFYKET